MFAYLTHTGVKIKEKITGNTASVFLLFWQNTGPKKPIYETTPFCVMRNVEKLKFAVFRALLIFKKRFSDAVSSYNRPFIVSTSCTGQLIATS